MFLKEAAEKANHIVRDFLGRPQQREDNPFQEEVLPIIDQPEQVQEQAFTPDLRIPKTVLWSLRRNKSLDPLTEIDESRLEVLSTLAGIATLDRNFRYMDVNYYADDEPPKIKWEKHVSRRWKRLQLSALDQITQIDGEFPVNILRNIASVTRLADRPPVEGKKPAEELRDKVGNIEKYLIGPAHENFLGSFSFTWLPWHRSWEGTNIQGPYDMFDDPSDDMIIEFDSGKRRVKTADDERRKVQQRACALLGTMSHPSAIRQLVILGGIEWRGYTDVVKKAFVQKGLEEASTDTLMNNLHHMNVNQTYAAAREIGERGLNQWEEAVKVAWTTS